MIWEKILNIFSKKYRIYERKVVYNNSKYILYIPQYKRILIWFFIENDLGYPTHYQYFYTRKEAEEFLSRECNTNIRKEKIKKILYG